MLNFSETTKKRALVCLILAAILIPSLFIASGNAFRIIIIIGLIMATIEFFSMTVCACISIPHTIISGTTLAASLLFLMTQPVKMIVLALSCVVLNDAFAYIFGRAYGGHIFEDWRPFPKTSPGKTWEGIAGGFISEIFFGSLIAIKLYGIEPPSEVIFIVCIGGLVAIVGDYYESRLKRQAEIKDSNDFIKDIPALREIEMLLGGRNGHGGYYDRLDSAIMLCSVIIAVQTLKEIIPI